ncbi:hypothetical protein R5R35_012153 [Gryllus longicercus]|uniref:Uncharacterized protein n=1 Tax=Gryllus longicercus TaxID=2509291 RepID=A0AAN9ZBM7_9ORTH
MGRFYYMDVSLTLITEQEISAISFKQHILHCLKTLFGDLGASAPVDVLKYDVGTQRGIVRCPASFYVKLRTSLVLCGDYWGKLCVYKVHQSSSSLISLVGNSRTFCHGVH